MNPTKIRSVFLGILAFSENWTRKQEVGHCDLIPQQISFNLIILKTKVLIMLSTKFQPNTYISSHSEEKVDFIGFAIFSIGSHLRFSTRLNFIILKPCILHVKFENHGCSGFRECHFKASVNSASVEVNFQMVTVI